MDTYFFVVPSEGRADTLLRSDIFTRLLGSPTTRAIILSQKSEDEHFKSEFSAPNVVHAPLQSVTTASGVRLLLRLRDALLRVDSPILKESSLILRGVRENKVLRVQSSHDRFLATIRSLIAPLRPALVMLLNTIESLVLRNDAYEELCRNYRPKAVLLGTLGVVPEDLVWLVHARAYSIPAFAVDLPWNYFEDRMLSLPRPAHVCVWNKDMATRAEKEFFIPRNHIHITGCARYDHYEKFIPQPRSTCARRINADSARPLIAYFLGSPPSHRSQELVVEQLLKSIRNGKFPGNPQLLIRFGPSEKPTPEFEALAKQFTNDLIINIQERMPHKNDVANIIHYSAVTLSHFSSLALDAAVLNRPHLYVGFSGLPQPNKSDVVMKRIFEFDFVTQALTTGGVHVAYSIDELISNIDDGFRLPDSYKHGQQKLLTHFLGPVDGKAGERIAQSIQENS